MSDEDGSGSGSGWGSGSGFFWEWYSWKMDKLKDDRDDLYDDLYHSDVTVGVVSLLLCLAVAGLLIALIVTCCKLKQARRMANVLPVKQAAVAPVAQSATVPTVQPDSSRAPLPRQPFLDAAGPLPVKAPVYNVLPAVNAETLDSRADLMPNSPPPAYRSPSP